MKNSRIYKYISALAIACLILPVSTASLAAKGGGGFRSMAGSWDAEISFGGATSRAMYSFHRDGTLTEADNPGFDPNFGDDALSPGIGSWTRTARRSGVAKYQKFAYNRSGQLSLVYVSTIEMTLNGDGTLSGEVSLSIRTPDGVEVNAIPDLPFTATRITPY